ncbi:MAG TPA: aminotransferase class III-fold pyridoxal phosphate-dependent enzyme [Jatrophihabitantaceae bacterium]|nr:aminotransferase class III-fold pyridoxal phosphate-dependent enzyme [Jatrophihabitantaceae bacterium]
MWYYRRLADGLTIMHTRPEHAPALEQLQRLCFPTLDDAERFKAAHYRKHLELFPDGQLVALDGDRVVGATTTLRLHFDFNHIGHSFADIIQGGWLTSHDPGGDWLYGADIGVDPGYRGRGLARALYAARQEVVWRFGLEGQVTAGMIRGYGDVKDRMTADEYYAGVVAGRFTDPTLTAQLRIGFEPRALLANYLHDPVCDNYSVLLVLDAGKDVPGASRTQARSYIRVNTEIPGPRARDLLARRQSAVPAGLGRATDVVVERAHGELIFDVDGNTFIDLAGGLGMLAVGHTPPSVVNAIAEQAQKFIHVCALVSTYEPYVRLAEILNAITPGTFAKKTIFANSGAESVEYAIKLSRKYTGRPAVICFEGGYHGRTLLTLSLTSKYGLFKSGFGPFAPEIVRLPIPDVYRTPTGMTEAQYVDFGIRQLENALVAQVDPSAVAAMIIEPVQGEAGFIPVPPRFLRRIRELCDKHGIVLIADEVQCGFGRTGRLFAVEHYDVVPDVIVTAKSLGAGMPIGAVTGRADIMDSAHWGGIGGTYGGSPVACAAAIEAIDIIRRPEFLAHARHLGDVMREVLHEWKAKFAMVGDVRGLGPMMLAEFVRDRDTKEPATPDETLSVVRQAVANGVVVMRAGLYSNCVRLLPPLTMPEDMLREGLDALGRAIEVVSTRHATASV